MAVIFSFGSLFTLIYGGDALRGASRVIAFREASLSMDGVATAPAGDGKPLTSTHWEDSKIKARDGYDFLVVQTSGTLFTCAIWTVAAIFICCQLRAPTWRASLWGISCSYDCECAYTKTAQD